MQHFKTVITPSEQLHEHRGAEAAPAPSEPRAYPESTDITTGEIFYPNIKPQRSPQPNPFFKMTCFHLLVPGVN